MGKSNKFTELLEMHLQKQGLNKAAFAKEVGIDQSDLIEMLSGDRTPSEKVVNKMTIKLQLNSLERIQFKNAAKNCKFIKILDKHIEVRIKEKMFKSRADFAKKVDIDSSYLNKILSGNRNPPSREIVRRISNVLRLQYLEETELLEAARYAPVRYAEIMVGAGADMNEESFRIKGVQKIDEFKTELIDNEDFDEDDLALLEIFLQKMKEDWKEKKKGG